jgi:hypothetical protein
MENWKKMLVAGSAAGSAIMFLKKKPGAGILLAGVSLVALAAEYPQQFTKVRRALPDYFSRGMRLAEFASRASERMSEFAQRRGRDVWNEISS